MREERRRQLRADLVLLAVAAIWGSAFVAQRRGMQEIGPFAFTATRFAIGALALAIFTGVQRLRAMTAAELRHGLLLGVLLFGGASLQQIGIVYTTAGKAGFITGLYVVIVPLLLALVWHERVNTWSWIGAGLAVCGLFLLSIRSMRLAPGDGWVLGSALMWALHVIAAGRVVAKSDALRLAVMQYVTCSLLSLIAAAAMEGTWWTDLRRATGPLLYAGLVSTGVAYTAQLFAQRYAPPTHAAVILSLETVFAALAGWLLLGETLTTVQVIGCALMLSGMLAASARA